MTASKPVCLVTGGTSGVGRAIAEGVARAGMVVVIPGRDPERTEIAVRQLSHVTDSVDIHGMTMDLASLDSIREGCQGFREKFGRLDVLSCNAAVLSMRREETVDGLERTLAVNYLSHFLITQSLWDLLLEGPLSRVIVVSGTSGVIERVRLRWDDLQFTRDYGPVSATLHAAAAKVLFVRELARRTRGKGLVSHTFDPGIVRSRLGRNLPAIIRPVYRLANVFFPRGCPTGVFLATDPTVCNQTGDFYARSRRVAFHPRGQEETDGVRLWTASERLLSQPAEGHSIP